MVWKIIRVSAVLHKCGNVQHVPAPDIVPEDMALDQPEAEQVQSMNKTVTGNIFPLY